jgi:hypothetical protein
MNLHAGCSHGAVRGLERATQKIQAPLRGSATTFVRSFLAVPAQVQLRFDFLDKLFRSPS